MVRKVLGWSALLVAIGALVGAVASGRLLRPIAAVRASLPPDTLVASIRAEPRSFNRYTARDLSTAVLTFLMHASLVRIDHATHALEPELAERWQLLPDGRTYRIWLRPDLRFSDGAPFSAADVVFSFQAIYDRTVDSVLADTLEVGGQRLAVTEEDARTLTIRFPSPFGPGLRMLDGVPMYPRHRLAAALGSGAFGSMWRSSTAPSEIAGLGPFVLRSYEPGQRLTFDRNPYYRGLAGALQGPAHVVLSIVPDQDAELLQLQTGGIDLTQSELRPGDVAALRTAIGSGQVRITDGGVGLDGDLLWFNLSSAQAAGGNREWLQTDFRRAVSRSIDRRAFVDMVYLGLGVPADGIVSPGNREWHADAPLPAYDRDAARRLFASIGLFDRDGDGRLDDRDGRAVQFSLLTQKGNTSLERGASFIRDSLREVGVQVDLVALDGAALLDYVMRGNYDAAYFRLLTTDTDPALNADFWLSSGGAHMWNPRQPAPATRWEREIDALMNEGATTLDLDRRRALFARVQEIVAREVPILCFGFPRFPVAVSSRLVNARPAAFRPPLLWNAGRMGLTPSP
jgi:peptide/nickel transport system substrate-binding protein